MVSGGRTDGLNFELFHEQVSNKGANGRVHNCTIDLFKILTLEEEVDVLRQNSSKGMIWEIYMEVMWGSRGSCCSLFLD